MWHAITKYIYIYVAEFLAVTRLGFSVSLISYVFVYQCQESFSFDYCSQFFHKLYKYLKYKIIVDHAKADDVEVCFA